MRYPYAAIVAPRFLDAISWVIPIGNITLWPVIVSRESMTDGDREHEEVHIAQQVELALAANVVVAVVLLVVIGHPWSAPLWPWLIVLWCYTPGIGPYFILYGLLWLAGRLAGQDGVDAYMNNPLEIEAYEYASPTYLDERRLFAWIRSRR